MRPIDADVLENMGYELHRTYQQDANTMVYEVKKIADVPTIEAKPVRHGRWLINKEDGWITIAPCSVCGGVQDVDFPYCPNCGAKMEG